MEFLNEFMLPVVLGICLCMGYVIKQWVKDVDNKYIPTICAILGAFLAVWINNWVVNPQILLSGLISGLSATGGYELFKQYLEKKEL